MKRAIKTLLLVVLLTALIWAWAEQSQTRTLDKQLIELTVDVPATTGFAVYEPATRTWGHSVKVQVIADFNGQQGGVSELSQLITRGEYPSAHSLRLDDKLRGSDSDSIQTVRLDLRTVLNGQPVLARLHVVAIEAKSGGNREASVEIGRLKDCRLPIQVQVSDLAGGQPVLKDKEASVRLPAPLHAALPKDFKIVANVLSDVGPEGEQTAVLPHDIEGYPIQPMPDRTTFTRSVTLQEQESRFADVQVQAVFPPGFQLQSYYLNTPDQFQWRKTVTVSGPAGTTITAADVKLQLVFERDDTKPTEVPLTRDVEVSLPPGFRLVKIEPDKSIQFNFKERKDRTTP